jgi:hypothetical protein
VDVPGTEIRENPDLKQKLMSANISDETAFLKVVNDAGYDFTIEEYGI